MKSYSLAKGEADPASAMDSDRCAVSDECAQSLSVTERAMRRRRVYT